MELPPQNWPRLTRQQSSAATTGSIVAASSPFNTVPMLYENLSQSRSGSLQVGVNSLRTTTTTRDEERLLAVLSQLIGASNVFRLADKLRHYLNQQQQQQDCGVNQTKTNTTAVRQTTTTTTTGELILAIDRSQQQQPEDISLGLVPVLDLDKLAHRRLALSLLRFLGELVRRSMDEIMQRGTESRLLNNKTTGRGESGEGASKGKPPRALNDVVGGGSCEEYSSVEDEDEDQGEDQDQEKWEASSLKMRHPPEMDLCKSSFTPPPHTDDKAPSSGHQPEKGSAEAATARCGNYSMEDNRQVPVNHQPDYVGSVGGKIIGSKEGSQMSQQTKQRPNLGAHQQPEVRILSKRVGVGSGIVRGDSSGVNDRNLNHDRAVLGGNENNNEIDPIKRALANIMGLEIGNPNLAIPKDTIGRPPSGSPPRAQLTALGTQRSNPKGDNENRAPLFQCRQLLVGCPGKVDDVPYSFISATTKTSGESPLVAHSPNSHCHLDGRRHSRKQQNVAASIGLQANSICGHVCCSSSTLDCCSCLASGQQCPSCKGGCCASSIECGSGNVAANCSSSSSRQADRAGEPLEAARGRQMGATICGAEVRHGPSGGSATRVVGERGSQQHGTTTETATTGPMSSGEPGQGCAGEAGDSVGQQPISLRADGKTICEGQQKQRKQPEVQLQENQHRSHHRGHHSGRHHRHHHHHQRTHKHRQESASQSIKSPLMSANNNSNNGNFANSDRPILHDQEAGIELPPPPPAEPINNLASRGIERLQEEPCKQQTQTGHQLKQVHQHRRHHCAMRSRRPKSEAHHKAHCSTTTMGGDMEPTTTTTTSGSAIISSQSSNCVCCFQMDCLRLGCSTSRNARSSHRVYASEGDSLQCSNNRSSSAGNTPTTTNIGGHRSPEEEEADSAEDQKL